MGNEHDTPDLRVWPTVRQVAEQWGVTGRYVLRLIAAKRLTGERIANTWLVDPASVAGFKGQRKPRTRRVA